MRRSFIMIGAAMLALLPQPVLAQAIRRPPSVVKRIVCSSTR